MFSVPQPDLQVWQLLLESFRSNDVQALEPAAPKSITPFINDLYQDRKRYPWVLTASHLHQAGVRTSQALSAMLCGLGSTPFSLSVSRDFGKLSLRCLQEVLGDGGFKPTAFFGSDMGFDRMSLFFGSRGVETVEERQMPKGLPRGGWGLSDRAVFQSALAHQAHTQQPTFNFVFSVSNHSPYTAPEDLPAEVKSRVAALRTDSFGQPVSPDDLSRLTTLSYTDFAASEFVTVLEERRKRAIVVLAPDHNTPETFLWGTKNPPPSEASKLSVLPLAIVFSEALVASLAPETQQQLRAALAHVNQRLQSDILSQNDLPRLVLALLSAAPGMRNMPEGRRWHTLGGQTTSPEFRAPFNPKALVWGLAADTRLFTVTESGATSFHGHSQNPPTSLGDLAQLDKEPLAPEARLLAAFLRDYDEPCGGTTDENAQEKLGP